jgi:hypothetical protein
VWKAADLAAFGPRWGTSRGMVTAACAWKGKTEYPSPDACKADVDEFLKLDLGKYEQTERDNRAAAKTTGR